MRLQKVLQACPHRYAKRCSQGVLSVAFFLFLCWVGYLIASSYGFILVCNTLGAFSLPLEGPFFIIGICAMLFFLGVQWWREKDVLSAWAWLFLFSGGLSNAYERVVFGCVRDYISLPFIPIFNIADVLLTIGAIGILWKWWHLKN